MSTFSKHYDTIFSHFKSPIRQISDSAKTILVSTSSVPGISSDLLSAMVLLMADLIQYSVHWQVDDLGSLNHITTGTVHVGTNQN